MLFVRPFIALLLAQTAAAAPAPAPDDPHLANHPNLGSLFHGISRYVKRLFGLSTRTEIENYGNYGAYGKYGGYGSYPDIGGGVNSETSSDIDAGVDEEVLTTLTTTMPVFTTTVTLRSIVTPSPTITAVSTASRLGQMSTRTRGPWRSRV